MDMQIKLAAGNEHQVAVDRSICLTQPQFSPQLSLDKIILLTFVSGKVNISAENYYRLLLLQV